MYFIRYAEEKRLTEKENTIFIPQADAKQHATPPEETPELQGEDPFTLFKERYETAMKSEISDPNAMCLSTVDKSGFPNARMVLLKGFDSQGFVFYTNTDSAKGVEIAENPKAALCFHWKSVTEQVRVRGIATRVSEAEADEYFNSRDRQSRIGAHVSKQSHPLASRTQLIKEAAIYGMKFALGTVPRPENWSGYRITPLEIEFWRNGAFRLHDRLVFQRNTPEAPWTKFRLYP